MSEQAPVQKIKINPLMSILRQPKIYISLPSQGRYWAPGSLNPSVNGEYPVYSMTARDELMLKTPDALLNGQGVVEVIQNCLPNIINAWECPQIDLDTIFIAIRVATYGEKMNMAIKHPSMEDETMDYEVNIREILDQRQAGTAWEDRLEVRSDLVVYLKPLNYRAQTDAQIGDFETSRIINIIKDESTTEEEKISQFQKAFSALSKKTIDIIGKAIYKIESSAGTTEDPDHIQEFISECDAEMFDKIRERLGMMNQANQLRPMTITSTPEMIANGAPPTLEVPFTFDQASFFG